jgi:hypothetical protein
MDKKNRKKIVNEKYNKKIKEQNFKKNFILYDDEEFKEIIDNEKYLITNKGRVYSKITNKFLKPHLGKSGYLTVTLQNRKHHLLHRLLCVHFLDNPENKQFIDHIDRNRTNNNLNNLRWATPSENNINKAKGTIHKTIEHVNGKEYVGYRCYWYEKETNKKYNKRFKNLKEAEIFMIDKYII